MTGNTTIEWTAQPGYRGASWNPTTGCTRVSAGCDNCYAFALHDKRYASNLKKAREDDYKTPALARAEAPTSGEDFADLRLPWPKQYDLPFSRVQLLEDRLDAPLRTRTPTCYFVDSMADLFHEDVPDEYIARVFNAMCAVPYKDGEPKRGWWDENPHRFLILTKRPERMRQVIENMGRIVEDALAPDAALSVVLEIGQWPLPNVWLGTSVEDQKAADERIPHLLATPAAVRFLSCEPLLGPVDLTKPRRTDWCVCQLRDPYVHKHYQDPPHSCARCSECQAYRPQQPTFIEGIDWLIVGGESGSRARPMDLAWARSLVEQCRAAGVAPFVKQLGSVPFAMTDEWTTGGIDYKTGRYTLHPYDKSMAFYPKLRESHGRDMAEWPEDLRVREWPVGA